MLHVRCAPDEAAPFRRASDHRPRTNRQLVLVGLRRCAAQGNPFWQCTTCEVNASCAQRCHAGRLGISPPEEVHAGRARRRLHRRPLRMRGGANLEVWLDAALTADVPAGIESGRLARHSAEDRAHEVIGDATVHPLLIETLLESRRVYLDEGQALREPRRREAERSSCAATLRFTFIVVAPFVWCSAISNRGSLLDEDCDIDIFLNIKNKSERKWLHVRNSYAQ